jgi:hypothetical protein
LERDGARTENSHTPQQPKAGGDDEAVSTDLSVSPQNDQIVRNSEQDPAAQVTSSSGAAGLLQNGDKEYKASIDLDLVGGQIWVCLLLSAKVDEDVLSLVHLLTMFPVLASMATATPSTSSFE